MHRYLFLLFFIELIFGQDSTSIEDQFKQTELINRKNEIGVVNPSAYQQLVPGAARGNDKNNDQYILLSYRLEFYIPNNKGPVFRKPSAYQ